MSRIRYQSFRPRVTVSAMHPALFLVAATQWIRPRCVQCGRWTRRRGVVLVVWQAWQPRAPQLPGHPAHDPWCADCAYTWWGIDINELGTDAPASDGWRYLGTPWLPHHLRERGDGSGPAHRLSKQWRQHLIHHN